MNSVQTVTLNSAQSQNWVGCTVRTPRTQECPFRGRCCAHSRLVASMSHAQPAQVAHAGRTLVATRSGSLPPGRDHTSMLQHQGNQNHVATLNRCRDTIQTTPCRDIKSVSRHRFSCPVPKPGRDVLFPSRDLLKLRLCRDIVSMS